MKTPALLLMTCISCSFPAWADTIDAKLHFENILPFTGIIYVPDPSEKMAQRGTLDQHDKQFSTSLVVASPNSELKIKNSDDFEHNIYADDQKQTGIAFDLGRIEAHEEFRLPIRWKEDSLLRLGCKIHPKMKAYVANIRSRYYNTLPFMPGKKDYEVALERVPARLEEIRILLPDLPPLSAELRAGQSRSLPVTVNGREVGKIELSRRGD